MTNLSICVPTFHRPHALESLVKNIHEATTTPHSIYFVTEPDDAESIAEINRLGENLIINKYPGTHTGAANTAYESTSEPYFIIANDDFTFHLDWDVRALLAITGFGVCGLSDGFSKQYTQITLVDRNYIETQSGVIDEPNTLYHRGYHHNYVDTEFSETAKKRGMFTTCSESVVEHRHYSYNKSPMDDTYRKTLTGVSHDMALYESRRHLWE